MKVEGHHDPKEAAACLASGALKEYCKAERAAEENADLEDPDAPSAKEDFWSQYAQKVVEALTERLKPGYVLVRDAGSTSVKISDKNGKQVADIEAEITAMKVEGHHDPKEAADILADNVLKSYCGGAKKS